MEDAISAMSGGLLQYMGTGTGDTTTYGDWEGEVARRWREQYIHSNGRQFQNPYPTYVASWVDPPIIKKEMNRKLLLL